MTKIDFDEVKVWVAGALALHSHGLAKALASRYQVSGSTASATIKKLEQSGLIKRTGSVNRPVFEAGSNSTIMQSYSLPLGDAELIWQRDFAALLMPGLDDSVRAMLGAGFIAIANNASQHSQGKCLNVIVEQTSDYIEIILQDNGMGVFKHIAKAKNYPDLSAAVAELNATGSISALSKKFDFFLVEANGLHYPEGAAPAADADAEELFEQGTTVIMELTLNH